MALLLCGCADSSANHAADAEAAIGNHASPTTSSAQASVATDPLQSAPANAQPDISSLPILDWETVDDLPKPIAVFDQVFWEPDDTNSLRELIRNSDLVQQKSVLEIGTGAGLIALCCLQSGATQVVATDINPHAVRNAGFNAQQLGFADRLDVRLVPRRSPEAWTVIRPDERFDVIISNPPWEDGKPKQLSDFALYDPDFRLMTSLLDGFDSHLQPNGRILLAYGCVTAIRLLQKEAARRELTVTILDDRSLDDLDELFLPGMLLEITRQHRPSHASD